MLSLKGFGQETCETAIPMRGDTTFDVYNISGVRQYYNIPPKSMIWFSCWPCHINATYLYNENCEIVYSNREGIYVFNSNGDYILFFDIDSLTNGSQIVVKSHSVGILPITWRYINSKINNDEIIISWGVGENTRNGNFVLERSLDIISWTSIGEVNNGTDLDYEFIDLEPVDGVSYYRINLLLDNNERILSETIAVNKLKESIPFLYNSIGQKIKNQ